MANTVKADGWKWVEVQPEADYRFLHRHRRIQARAVPLSPEAQAELDALTKEYQALQQQLEEEEPEGGEEEQQEPAYTRLGELENRIEQLQESRTGEYPEEVKAACGVVVTIGPNGSPELVCGLLRKEEEAALTTSSPTEESAVAPVSSPAEDKKAGYSAALIETLTAQKTAAMAAELSQNPRVALAATVHALVLQEFHFDLRLYRATGCLQISSSRPNLSEANGSPALAVLEQQRQDWLSRFPQQPNELWSGSSAKKRRGCCVS